MLDKIIYFSIKNKIVVVFLTISLVVWGVWSSQKLSIDAVPDITNNQVQIITLSPALAAQEVERFVTFPVELSMANIPNLEEIRSISRFGLSVVTVVFTDNTDIYWARQQVSERLKVATERIPFGMGIPDLGPVSSGLGEIYQYTIHAKKGFESQYTAMDMRTIQDWTVKRQLLGTDGVADVSSFGGYLKQYEIAIDPDKLRSMNMSIATIFTALQSNNQNTGGAYIEKNPNSWVIRTDGCVKNLNDIEQIVVSNTLNGMPILIKDIAKVQYGYATRYGALTYNDKGEAVGGIVMMLKGANSSEVISSVKNKISQIQKTLPDGIVIEAFLDRTNLVDRAIATVSKNLIEGALIVIFVLILFLGNLRAGLIVASVIPLAMLFAISLMNLFGVSGNLMSLGAIDFGLIVDGAVIIVEATLHHLMMNKTARKLTQDQMDGEVYDSASNIRKSAAFGEIIILIVYLPILALVGIEGKMFAPMAQTVVFAILGAFILSLTYVPMISSLFLNKNIKQHHNFSDKMMDYFYRLYTPLLLKALNKKFLILGSSLILLIGSLIVFYRLGGEFIPTLDEGDFAVETRLLAGSSLSQTVDVSVKASGILLKKFPNEVKQVVGKVGTSEIPTDPMPVEACDLMIILKNKNQWTKAKTRDELATKMKEELDVISGVSFGFQQPIQMRFNELMTGARQDVAIKIYGDDLDELTKQAKKLSHIIEPIEGVEDLYVEEVTGLPQIVVSFDRSKIAQFGLNIVDVNNVINTAFAGKSAGLIYEGEKSFDIVVRLDKNNRQNIEDVQNLYVTNVKGNQIPLRQVAKVEFKVGPNQIQRDDTKRRIIVAFNIRNRDVETIVKEIISKTDSKLDLPTGYHLSIGGQFKNLEQAKQRLSIAVPIALSLIFMMLFFTFNSFKQSILVFTAIPLSAIGGIAALWLRDMPFSISAGIGFIALFGVAVLNGIVLIGEFNNIKKSGLKDLKQIILQGTKTRLRPVLMTATVASLGFLPMALSHGSGAEVQKPLATVVIGGLISATILTLLILPILYLLSENKKDNTDIKTIVASVILLFVVFNTNAQTQQAITLEKAIDIAIVNNDGVKSAQMGVEYQKNLQKTSTDIGKTNFGITYGQFNSYYLDNGLTISQSLPFPTVLKRQSQYYKATIEGAEINQKVIENQLIFAVKSTYMQLQYAKAIQDLLIRQDSLNQVFLNYAELRLKTGATNLLEVSTAKSQIFENNTLIDQNKNDIQIFENQLKTFLNTNDPITSSKENELKKLTLNLQINSESVNQNPLISYNQNQIKILDKATKIERSKLLPDLNIGYFNNSIYGTIHYQNPKVISDQNTRFQGLTFGFLFPIWIKPQLARIKANTNSRNMAESNFNLLNKNLANQYFQANQEYQKYQKSLENYETNSMPLTEMMLKYALKNYQTGNIGYIEFSQNIYKVLTIQSKYLNMISLYNQSIINLEYISGNLK